MKIFGRQPALAISILNAVVLLLGTFGLGWINGDQAGLIVAAIGAASGAVLAFTTRPIAPSAFISLVSALTAVASAYGLNLSAETVAAINSVVVSLVAFVAYGNISPVETAVTKSSDNPTPEAVAHEASNTDEPVFAEEDTPGEV